jgi:hypothetical protein
MMHTAHKAQVAIMLDGLFCLLTYHRRLLSALVIIEM